LILREAHNQDNGYITGTFSPHCSQATIFSRNTGWIGKQKIRGTSSVDHGFSNLALYREVPVKKREFSRSERSEDERRGLFESPVMSVIEGAGFHPFIVPVCRDGGYLGLPVKNQ
jgi:hypothetical protein